jgi:hypothetical protein
MGAGISYRFMVFDLVESCLEGACADFLACILVVFDRVGDSETDEFHHSSIRFIDFDLVESCFEDYLRWFPRILSGRVWSCGWFRDRRILSQFACGVLTAWIANSSQCVWFHLSLDSSKWQDGENIIIAGTLSYCNIISILQMEAATYLLLEATLDDKWPS